MEPAWSATVFATVVYMNNSNCPKELIAHTHTCKHIKQARIQMQHELYYAMQGTNGMLLKQIFANVAASNHVRKHCGKAGMQLHHFRYHQACSMDNLVCIAAAIP